MADTATEPSTERITDPVHRTSYSFRRDGENLWVDTWFEDGAHLPEHFHPTLEEHWEIVEGTAQVKLDGSWRELRPEDGPVVVARGVRHELKNTSGRQAHGRTHVIPAGHLVEFLTDSAQAARDGLYNARNMPTSLRGALWIAEFADRHSGETVVTSPPPALQRLVVPLVARIARSRRKAG
jgi:mannose-6-phosphate isomerase-like protein (cupin superfamily)